MLDGDRFRVDVQFAAEASFCAPQQRGYLMLSPGFEVLESESRLESNAKAPSTAPRGAPELLAYLDAVPGAGEGGLTAVEVSSTLL